MSNQSNGQSVIVQGRIVWTSGDLFKGNHQKDDRTKQLKYNQDGTPVIQYGFGLAIPKIDPKTNSWHPEYVKIYQALQAEALTLFPGGQIPQNFAMKFKDGDTDVDPSGTPYKNREGYVGHIVLACTTYIPIKYFRYENGNHILVNEGFKNGDYVNVQVNIKAHPAIGQGKAGLYVNPSAVQFIQAGKEIINTPSGDQIFGMAAPVYQGEVVAPEVPTMPMGAPMGQPAMPGMGQRAPANQFPVNNGGLPPFPGR